MKLPLLTPGILISRYRRFLADIRLNDGTVITAHCPNSGSMKTCNEPGSTVMLSRSMNPRRRLPFTWEMIQMHDIWVGINTAIPNRLVQEGIEQGVISELQGYSRMRQEVKYGTHSRIDWLLENGNNQCYVEVKNVTLAEGEVARFPDAVTLRGQKHLQELMEMVFRGHRAAMLFIVQREDCCRFAPADDIDPVYGKLLRKAAGAGVELLVYQARVTPAEIRLYQKIPIIL